MMDETTTLTPTEELHGKISSDIASRQQWLNRQTTWYAMRHDGIRRKNKPWPWATDLHDPLADTIIDKLKPFYFNQLFGTETVAQFMAKDAKLQAFAQQLALWFDYKLKQSSNLEGEMLLCIDKMLMAGHDPVRVGWDADKKQLFFDAIDPTKCIVPDQTERIEDADRVCIVHHMTPDAYRRDDRFNAPGAKDDEFIKRITGEGSYGDGGAQTLRNAQQLREGITHGAKESQLIIIWEVWEHLKDGRWMIHWFSPSAPREPVRVSQLNVFEHGRCPIVRFDLEVKEKGWYASRGVSEKVAPYESWSTRMWNEKGDSITLFNRPVLTSNSPIPNAGNLRMMPGQIMGTGLAALQFGRPPFSFDEEINATRGVAERNIGVPDYGIGDLQDKNQPRTAHEVVAIGQQSSAGVDLRARTFRINLGELLQLAWETLLQYDKETTFFVAGQVQKLPQEALQAGQWMLKPNGSSDTWNKPLQMQKAVQRMTMFGPSQGFPQGMPWINQPELAKSVLEIDDPRLVERLFIDPNQRQRDEYEDEALKIPTLCLGMPLQGDLGQDQATRIKCLVDFMESRGKLGHPLDPLAAQALQNRIKEHLAVMQQKDPKGAMQMAKGIDALAQQHAQPQIPAGGNPTALPPIKKNDSQE